MKFVRGFIGLSVIITNLCLVNIFQLLSYLIYPFPYFRPTFRRMQQLVPQGFWVSCIFLLEKMSKVRFIIVSDDPNEGPSPLPARKENAIVMANHQSACDILAIAYLALKTGTGGDLKFLAKDVLKYVPLLGTGMKLVGCLFLKRSWSNDKKTIYEAFKHIIENKIPLWLVTFPEGTRITPKKLKRAQEFSNRRRTFYPRHVLIPRTKGFVASATGLRDQLQAVYDIGIYYPGKIPSLVDFFCKPGCVVYIHVRRFPIQDLPQTDKELIQWHFKRFEDKDNWLASFLHDHDISKGS